MKKLFIPYELAVIAKEKGFDETCFGLITDRDLYMLNISDEDQLDFDMGVAKYNGRKCVPAPLYQQIVDWFMRKDGIYIWVMPVGIENETVGFWWEVEVSNSDFNMISDRDYTQYKTYYEALNKAIENAFKLI